MKQQNRDLFLLSLYVTIPILIILPILLFGPTGERMIENQNAITRLTQPPSSLIE